MEDDRLVQFIHLEVLKESNVIIWTALGTVLSELESPQASAFLHRLAELFPGLLQDAGKENSATQEHLMLMYQTLVDAVQSSWLSTEA